MEFKEGDELVKAKVKFAEEYGGMVLAETDGREFYGDADGKTYAEGLADAWNLACEIAEPAVIGGYGRDGLREMFGNDDIGFIFGNYTVSEAMKMTEQWKSEKEIHVGDVVVFKDGEKSGAGVVTTVNKDTGTGCLLLQDGVCGRFFDNAALEKTGRRIDVGNWLKQIGGEA